MRTKSVVGLLVALLIIGVAGAALAAPFGGSRMRGMGAGLDTRPDPRAELNLTDDQLAKIQAIQNECFEKTQSLRLTLMQKMHELRTLGWQKSPDKAVVDAKKAEVEQLQKQMNAISEEFRNKMNSVLTEEQLAKLGAQRGFGPTGFGQGRGNGFGMRARTR